MADEDKIMEVYKKIEREKSLIQAANLMRQQTNNDTVRSKLDTQMREGKRNLEFFEEKLKELQLRRGMQGMDLGSGSSSSRPHGARSDSEAPPTPPPKDASGLATSGGETQFSQIGGHSDLMPPRHPFAPPGPGSGGPKPRPNFTKLDLIKYDTPYLGPRIQLMLSQIQFKLNVEEQYLKGVEKMVQLYQMEGDKKSRADAAARKVESKQKITLLKQALKRYEELHIDTDSAESSDDDSINMPNLRKPLSGQLTIRVVAVKDVDHAPTGRFARTPDTFVAVKVEDAVVARTRATRNDRWEAEYHNIEVDKANEIELTVYDKPGEHALPIGLLWVRISDIAEELRRKRIEAEINNSGWVSADRMASSKSPPSQFPMNSQQPQPQFGPPPTSPGYQSAQATYPPPQAPTQAVSQPIDGWFNLEPTGQILLNFNFIKQTSNTHKFDVGLGRKGAVRQRKEEVHEMYGHKFVSRQFYNIMRCAFCADFLKYSAGMQCEDCKYTCHTKCYTNVVTKCISKSNAETDPEEEKINHRIPHRFQGFSNLTANWCCHCGYLLPFGRKNCRKCSECALTAHAQCTGMRIGLDHFNFLAVLGKGNFGKVMLAETKRSRKLYAIKVLKKEFIIENDEVESIRSEKRVFLIANRERHPFLTNLHACFQTETRVYFVMEYISGGDLMLHIQRGQFGTKRAQFYAAEVCLALKYFHENGVVYRDLKLDNILLTLDGHIKIADYGLCKEDMWFGSTTSTFCGTPEFMAPEILLDKKYGRAVDWWAFGVLIYQMLLQQSPFRGEDEDEIYDAILADEPLYPIHMPRDSVSILQKLLIREPDQRLGSGPTDAQEVMSQPFFRNINWDDIYHKRVAPPFLPQIKSATDTSNFDSEFTSVTPVLTPVQSVLSQAMQEEFRGFSYTADFE
ncbi:putative protein kinase c [Diaporthe ampelina]|uniref:Protein kinase C-like n=1 Tax=Diaporthe ampelina TaxID=1214573 RepID=A0A0G2FWI0_9PEZI|nr:putative protein kinase c [Diaporthe ampelina]